MRAPRPPSPLVDLAFGIVIGALVYWAFYLMGIKL